MSYRRIAFFCGGDSNDISTWSNVPYLFGKALERKGYELIRIDYSPNKIIERIYNSFMYFVYIRVFKQRSCPVYARTRMNRALTFFKIKRAQKRMADIDFNLFLTYELTNPYSTKQSVIWSDWSDEISILRKNGKINRYERYAVKRERESIAKADLMYTMFPVCKQEMEKMYNRKIHYLNRNVINSLYERIFDIEDFISKHKSSQRILFIGNFRYKGAAMKLIQSYNQLKKEIPNLKLDVIGMTKNELCLSTEDKDITAWGYLHKDVTKERQKYYELLIGSRVIVNPAEKWAAYSSIIEAMYFCCPIVVSPFPDFVNEFGQQIDFGYYCDELNLTEQIHRVFSDENYEYMCRKAHELVSDYTWDNYVDSFLEHLKSHNVDL